MDAVLKRYLEHRKGALVNLGRSPDPPNNQQGADRADPGQVGALRVIPAAQQRGDPAQPRHQHDEADLYRELLAINGRHANANANAYARPDDAHG